MTAIEVDVAFTPGLLARGTTPPVVVLVDVLRATSTVTALFSLGARGVEIAGGLTQARRRVMDGRVACAEEPSGRQAPRTELPVSPSRLTAEAVAQREVVLCTTNGTRALRRVAPHAEQLLLGCLMNASAAAEQALELATRLETGLSIVCAGRHANAIACLDDSYAAGAIAGRLVDVAAQRGVACELTDAARMACLVVQAAGTPLEALSASATGEVLRRAGCAEDIPFCARLDVTDVVPVLVRGGGEARYPVVLV